MYKCLSCRSCFDEPDTKSTSYEDYYGVAGLFPDRHGLTIEVCPRCGSEDFEQENLCESCKWHSIDSDSEDYCDNDECYDCDDYEEI